MVFDKAPAHTPRNPFLTVDLIIELPDGIVLIKRKNPPLGWALPGGFVDYGETIEAAAIREAQEETSLRVALIEQFHTYSEPARDPRHHTVTIVFLATAEGKPAADDDAAAAEVFGIDALPADLVFDHGRILNDYRRYRQGIDKHTIFRY